MALQMGVDSKVTECQLRISFHQGYHVENILVVNSFWLLTY